MFPELIAKNETYENKTELATGMTFLEKIKFKKHQIDENTYHLPKGWVKINYDKSKRKIIMDGYNSNNYYLNNDIIDTRVLDELVEKWDLFRLNYIETYGQDEYEKYYEYYDLYDDDNEEEDENLSELSGEETYDYEE